MDYIWYMKYVYPDYNLPLIATNLKYLNLIIKLFLLNHLNFHEILWCFFFKLLLAYPVLPCTYTQIYTMAISYGDLNFYLQHYGTLKHWYTIFSTTLGIHNLRSSLWPSILIQSPSHCDKFKMSNSKSRLSPFNHICHAKESRSYRNLFGSDCWIILIILFWNRFITELIVSKFCTNLKNSVRNILTKRWLDFLSQFSWML